jgi:hypothetical protein
MVDYWAIQFRGEPPQLAWLAPAAPGGGAKSLLWRLAPNGSNIAEPTAFATVPKAVEELADKSSLPSPKYTIAKYLFEPGQYHSRIWRDGAPAAMGHEVKAILSSDAATRLHFDSLDSIFSTVEPDKSTANAYGQKLRHFLILACTEVEAGWQGILAANGYPAKRWKTNDFVKLLRPMGLNQWKVRLASYPDYPEISPFADWDRARPTESLPWYSAYQKVKHNRETNLPFATLAHVISAAAAMYVMEMAQFGRQTHGKAFFNTLARPAWTPEQYYFPPLPPQELWKHVNCPIK